MERSRLHHLHNFIEKNTSAGFIVAIISFIIVFFISLTPFYEKIELTFYDLRFYFKDKVKQWDKLTVIRIDDNSIYHMGKFPWPRHFYAQGTLLLNQVKSRLTVFDIEFPDESPQTVNEELIYNLKNEGKLKFDEENINDLVFNNDKIFAQIIKQSGQVILPFSFHKIAKINRDLTVEKKELYDKARKIFLDKASIKIPKEKLKYFKNFIDPERTYVAFPTPLFAKHAKAFGYVDSDFDIDGSSRRIRLVRVFKDRIFFHLSLVMLANYCNITLKDIVVEPGEYVLLKNVENRISYKLEDIRIPIDNKGQMLINWAGPFETTFNHIPYHALLEYSEVYQYVHDYIAEQEISLSDDKYNNLMNQLEIAEETLQKTKNPKERLAIYKQIDRLRPEAQKLIDNLIKPVFIQQEVLQKAYKENPSEHLKAELENIENFATAVNIVKKIESLNDHITITGLTATATQDVGITPTSSHYWMVGSYHNVINTILQKQFIFKLPTFMSYFLQLVLSIFLAVFVQRLNAKKSIITIVLSLIFGNLIMFFIFSKINLWVDQIGINLSILLPTLTIAAIKLHKEESQKRFIKNAFAHYLSPPVIDQLILHPDTMELGGKEQELTTFFSDIQGFSTISEKLTPPQLVGLLNEYLSEMSDIILNYDGTVDKYEGDAIMAFYGAPHQFKDHAVRACYAAIDMQKRLEVLRSHWVQHGRDALFVRMGMNTGPAVVGNMGSHSRMDYTVMGDSVNLASRLEGANKFYSTYTMISETTYNKVKNFIEARELDQIQVVGKTEPTKVYELLCRKGKLDDDFIEMLVVYNKALELFKNRQWADAKVEFKNASKIIKHDGPSHTYMKRCTEFLRKPPPANWNGVYSLKAK